jgi:hypothetical protein
MPHLLNSYELILNTLTSFVTQNVSDVKELINFGINVNLFPIILILGAFFYQQGL